VLLVAVGGLGCQNKSCDGFSARPAASGQCDGHASAISIAPPGSPTESGCPYSGCDALGYPGGALCATLWSFVLGHDPEVIRARDLEGSFYSGGYGRYQQVDSIPSARRPPSE